MVNETVSVEEAVMAEPICVPALFKIARSKSTPVGPTRLYTMLLTAVVVILK